MNEQAVQANDKESKQSKRWGWILSPVVVAAIIGAGPQYLTMIRAWQIEVPTKDYHYAISQNQLWQRNAQCKLKLKPVIMQDDVKVAAGMCPSGDVQVNVRYANGEEIIRWIANEMQATPHSGAWSLGLSPAVAAESVLPLLQPAAGQVQIICQRWLSEGRLLRRVREGDKCYDEVINTFTGRVLERREVSCNQPC